MPISDLRDINLNVNANAHTISFTGNLNVESSYNPFAVQFVSNLMISCTIECNYNSVTYHITDLKLQKIYAGFGINNTTDPLFKVINEYNQAKEDKANAESNTNLSKKERKNIIKDAEDKIEDDSETLSKCESELYNRLDALKSSLQR